MRFLYLCSVWLLIMCKCRRLYLKAEWRNFSVVVGAVENAHGGGHATEARGIVMVSDWGISNKEVLETQFCKTVDTVLQNCVSNTSLLEIPQFYANLSISIAWCKAAVSTMHWRYCSFALNHHYGDGSMRDCCICCVGAVEISQSCTNWK